MKIETLISILNDVDSGPGSENGFELQRLFTYIGSKSEIDSLKHGESWKHSKRTINFTMDFDTNKNKKYFVLVEGYGCLTKGEQMGSLAKFVKVIELPDENENVLLTEASEIARILSGNFKENTQNKIKTAKVYWINAEITRTVL